MPTCCSARMLQDTLEYLAPYAKPPQTLEQCLQDKLASMMLLKFAETEHSAENVSFLLEVHELNTFVKVKSRLRRMLTRRTSARRTEEVGARRTDGPIRRSDIRRSERASDRGSRAEWRSRADTMPPPASERAAVELTRSILKKHVADNNLCLTENIGAALRQWLQHTEAQPVPQDLISAAYKMTLRTVEFDTFWRFTRSSHFQELLCLHLGRTLQHAAFKAIFEAELTPPQRDALAFWQEASALDVEASAPATSEAAPAEVQLAAAALFARHRDCLQAMCPDELEVIKAAIDQDGAAEASTKVLSGAMTAALNILVDPYVAFLCDKKNRPLLQELGVKAEHSFAHGTAAKTAGPAAPEAEGLQKDDDDTPDWAAGW